MSKTKYTAELIIANKELAFQNEEKEKRALELIIANKELQKADEYHKEYIGGLEEMIFMTSHKVRHPMANIMGVANILDHPVNSQDELKNLAGYIKQSVLTLDIFTKELVTFIGQLKKKVR